MEVVTGEVPSPGLTRFLFITGNSIMLRMCVMNPSVPTPGFSGNHLMTILDFSYLRPTPLFEPDPHLRIISVLTSLGCV